MAADNGGNGRPISVYQIENPLSFLQDDQLNERATHFANCISPGDPKLTALFIKAARIAKSPLQLAQIRDLTPQERDSLSDFRGSTFFKQAKPLRVTIVTLCLSGIVQGWIQSAGNGANQTWPQDFGVFLPNSLQPAFPGATWAFAAVNSITYFAAGLFGCFLSDPLHSVFSGRRGAIFVSACLCLVSVIGAACARSWKQLLIWRAILGLGMGSKASVTPIFGSEISPPHLRGALVMNWQTFDAAGIFLGFSANLLVSKATRNANWRWQTASICLPTLVLLSLILVVPESPRWLLKQDKFPEAFAAMRQLRPTELQAATELFYANEQLQLEVPPPHGRRQYHGANAAHQEGANAAAGNDYPFQAFVASTRYWIRFSQLFRHPRTRRSMLAAATVMLGQQLCGVNILAFYSSTFFRDQNSTKPDTFDSKAQWLSWGLGLANFIFTMPAYLWIDTRGRRFLLLTTYFGMILSMFAACMSSLRHSHMAAAVSVFIFIFILFYSLGQGPVAFTYSSEVFPLMYREVGMSFAVFVNLTGAGLLTLLVPLARDNQITTITAIFVGLGLVSFTLIFVFVPETAGATISRERRGLSYLSLEELNSIFGVSIRGHLAYQLDHGVPRAWANILWRLRLSDQQRGIIPPHLWNELNRREQGPTTANAT